MTTLQHKTSELKAVLELVSQGKHWDTEDQVLEDFEYEMMSTNNAFNNAIWSVGEMCYQLKRNLHEAEKNGKTNEATHARNAFSQIEPNITNLIQRLAHLLLQHMKEPMKIRNIFEQRTQNTAITFGRLSYLAPQHVAQYVTPEICANWLSVLLRTPEDREKHEASQGLCQVIIQQPGRIINDDTGFALLCKFIGTYNKPSEEVHGLRTAFYQILCGYAGQLGKERFMSTVMASPHAQALKERYLQHMQ
eukprot:g2019.t1